MYFCIVDDSSVYYSQLKLHTHITYLHVPVVELSFFFYNFNQRIGNNSIKYLSQIMSGDLVSNG